MNFVNDKNPVFCLRGSITYLFQKISDILYFPVGGCVHLRDVHYAFIIYAAANFAFAAGISVNGVKAVYCLGENLGAGCFSRASGTREEIGMCDSSGDKLVFQRFGDVRLSYYIGKCFRSPFAVKNLIHKNTHSLLSPFSL